MRMKKKRVPISGSHNNHHQKYSENPKNRERGHPYSVHMYIKSTYGAKQIKFSKWVPILFIFSAKFWRQRRWEQRISDEFWPSMAPWRWQTRRWPALPTQLYSLQSDSQNTICLWAFKLFSRHVNSSKFVKMLQLIRMFFAKYFYTGDYFYILPPSHPGTNENIYTHNDHLCYIYSFAHART